MKKQCVGSALVAALIAAGTLLSAPPAAAQPGCAMPPVSLIPITVMCYPAVPSGQHMRCQWVFGNKTCDWRWPDDRLAPPP